MLSSAVTHLVEELSPETVLALKAEKSYFAWEVHEDQQHP
jgi:hypothetical protein